ncbi:MAG TPA: sulfur carrier protein ThiS [Gemmatimonadaceae bacterium]|nr:sulfur carrier protein ThiS [Gemmatimonadaceae bacterium]
MMPDTTNPARRESQDRESLPDITLIVNGERSRFPSGMTVGELLAALHLDARMVVVEHNREILHDRELGMRRPLTEGDTLEIVHFVGGG